MHPCDCAHPEKRTLYLPYAVCKVCIYVAPTSNTVITVEQRPTGSVVAHVVRTDPIYEETRGALACCNS